MKQSKMIKRAIEETPIVDVDRIICASGLWSIHLNSVWHWEPLTSRVSVADLARTTMSMTSRWCHDVYGLWAFFSVRILALFHLAIDAIGEEMIPLTSCSLWLNCVVSPNLKFLGLARFVYTVYTCLYNKWINNDKHGPARSTSQVFTN